MYNRKQKCQEKTYLKYFLVIRKNGLQRRYVRQITQGCEHGPGFRNLDTYLINLENPLEKIAVTKEATGHGSEEINGRKCDWLMDYEHD